MLLCSPKCNKYRKHLKVYVSHVSSEKFRVMTQKFRQRRLKPWRCLLTLAAEAELASHLL